MLSNNYYEAYCTTWFVDSRLNSLEHMYEYIDFPIFTANKFIYIFNGQYIYILYVVVTTS